MNRILVPTWVAALVIAAAPNAFAEWPMFRGPNASGVSPSAKPPVRFGPDQAVLWKVPVPFSPSSPAVHGSRIFLTTSVQNPRLDFETNALGTLNVLEAARLSGH